MDKAPFKKTADGVENEERKDSIV
jgi:hypothetical protein